MRAVLADAPDGLRTIEAWAAVERLLARPVSKSTVKGMPAGLADLSERDLDALRRILHKASRKQTQ